METKSILFLIILLITLGAFTFSVRRIYLFFKLTKPAFKVRDIQKRISITLSVAFGQQKIFRLPVEGLLHALVFWGFLVISVGSIEMVIDGLFGTERVLAATGWFYTLISASGDIFAYVVLLSVLIFLGRRLFLHIKRFKGAEMKAVSKADAALALGIISLLMLSLILLNIAYLARAGDHTLGLYPLSSLLVPNGLSDSTLFFLHELGWWSHILLIFLFANILPYSKHFHVFMSIPNVFLSRLEPLGYLPNMENVMHEVKLMLNPDAVVPALETEPSRFGVKDIEDVSWKNYADALTCTECGRCTAVCPANLTGKKLSPRKIFVDLRARMKEKGPGLIRNGKDYDDGKFLLGDYISAEELWACTTCNACAQECPLNINHPTLILDMRRFLVMEEAAAPSGLNMMFTNIENNGAPWQFSSQDRLKWAEGLTMKIKK